MAAVALDAGAVADLAHHLQVELGPLPETSGLQVAPLLAQPAHALLHLGLDLGDRHQQLVARRDVMGGRVEVHLGALGEDLSGQGIDLDDPLHLVPEQLDAHHVFAMWRLDLEHVPADSELGA